MYPLIRCRCGADLGSIAILYEQMVIKHNTDFINKNGYDVMPTRYEHMDEKVTRKEIHDILHITRPCCVTCLMTNRNFKDFY